MERIEEIRAQLEAAGKCGPFVMTVCGLHGQDISAADDCLKAAPHTLPFLLAEVERLTTQQARIKAALLVAGCSDYTDDVARMAEEFLAQREEG